MTVYNILDYGAVADGITNSAAAIQKAVDVCSVQGGGRVLIPAGRFLSGTIELKSHVDLHLESGAELICSLNREDIINISAVHQGESGDESWRGRLGRRLFPGRHPCGACEHHRQRHHLRPGRPDLL